MHRSRSLVASGCSLSHLLGGSLPASSQLLHHVRPAYPTSTLLPPAPTGHLCAPDQFRRVLTRRLIVETLAAQPVRLERLSGLDSGIVELKLDRPEAKNAISKDMLRGIRSALELVNDDFSVNVMMISSCVPRVFCAGADLKERKLMTPPEVLSVPTIAVIEGAALGGGVELALSCDLRICGEEAVFALPETGLAIIPGAGGTQRLPRIIGKAAAKELIFTGRKVDAEEAESLGLVNYRVPVGDSSTKALEIARDINQKGPLALRMAKRAINEGLQVEMSSALKVEEHCYEQLLDTKDRLEGLAAFAEKRKPRYSGE